MLLRCSIFVIVLSLLHQSNAGEEEEEEEPNPDDPHPDVTIDPYGLRNKAYEYAYKNYYKTTPSSSKDDDSSSVSDSLSECESHNCNVPRRKSFSSSSKRKYKKRNARRPRRRKDYYPPQIIHQQPYIPQYIPHPAPFQMPPYNMYQPPPFMQYYPPPPPPPPPLHYGYHPFPPVYPPYQQVTKSEDGKEEELTTTQNLWELYQQLKLKFETTVQTTTEQEIYTRSIYNRRPQNGYALRDGYAQRENYSPYRRNNYNQNQQHNHPAAQPLTEKEFEVPTSLATAEQLFVRFSTGHQQHYQKPKSNYEFKLTRKIINTEKVKINPTREVITNVSKVAERETKIAPKINKFKETPIQTRIRQNIDRQVETKTKYNIEDIFSTKSTKFEKTTEYIPFRDKNKLEELHWTMPPMPKNIGKEGVIDLEDSSIEGASGGTEPDYVARELTTLLGLYLTPTPRSGEREKYGITLVQKSQNSLDYDKDMGYDWSLYEKRQRGETEPPSTQHKCLCNEHCTTAKPTKDWKTLYMEYKNKYEFPDLDEIRRIERAEYKRKKKLLYKSRGMTYDDGTPDETSPGENPFIGLGKDPKYNPGLMRSYKKK